MSPDPNWPDPGARYKYDSKFRIKAIIPFRTFLIVCFFGLFVLIALGFLDPYIKFIADIIKEINNG